MTHSMVTELDGVLKDPKKLLDDEFDELTDAASPRSTVTTSNTVSLFVSEQM